MVEVRGKYIKLIGSLMSLYPDHRVKVDKLLFEQTGKHYNELEPEGWYDVKWANLFIDEYTKASLSGEEALVTFGRMIYPTLEKIAGFPPSLKTTLDFIKFEAEGFERAHRGSGIKPRKFIKAIEGEVIVEAHSPGYNSKLYQGVFLGILEMRGVRNGKVVQTKSQEKGDPTSEFHITWQ